MSTKTPADLVAEVTRTIKCTTCGRDPGSPYRRSDQRGKIIEGCIDDAHTGHIYGTSLRWHMRPAAKQLRKESKARLKEILKSGKR